MATLCRGCGDCQRSQSRRCRGRLSGRRWHWQRGGRRSAGISGCAGPGLGHGPVASAGSGLRSWRLCWRGSAGRRSGRLGSAAAGHGRKGLPRNAAGGNSGFRRRTRNWCSSAWGCGGRLGSAAAGHGRRGLPGNITGGCSGGWRRAGGRCRRDDSWRRCRRKRRRSWGRLAGLWSRGSRGVGYGRCARAEVNW